MLAVSTLNYQLSNRSNFFVINFEQVYYEIIFS